MASEVLKKIKIESLIWNSKWFSLSGLLLSLDFNKAINYANDSSVNQVAKNQTFKVKEDNQ